MDVPVNNQRPAPPAVVDGVLEHLDGARRLDDDVEAVGVVLLELGVLGLGVGARERHVRVGGLELLGERQLGAVGGRDGYLGAAVLAEELG